MAAQEFYTKGAFIVKDRLIGCSKYCTTRLNTVACVKGLQIVSVS